MNFSNYRLVLWWISVLLIATGVFWANYFGHVQTVWENDGTHLALITSVVFVLSNLFLGWIAWKSANPGNLPLTKFTNYCWYLAEMLMALGMLGTVIGLIHMLKINSTVGTEADAAVKQAGMYAALGLALYTNVVGLLGSIVFSFQTRIIGVDDES